MHDNLERIPINKLNFEQLRERVQILQDRYDVLIRRFPQLGDSGFELDWANIVTPLINALTNKTVLKAYQKSEEIIEADGPPPYGDKTAVYDWDGRYWYWDGLDWAGVNNQQTLTSTLTQTPTSFKFESMFYTVLSSMLRFVATQTYIRGDSADVPPPYADKNKIYRYDGLYWYWNGNEWKSQESPVVSSSFLQKPYGFSLDGVLEVLTETSGRLTVSDSFIKMYPAGSDEPKVQFGYDDDSENSNPIIILGVGSSTETALIKGYPVRYGQGILLKTAEAAVVGMVSDAGVPKTLELRANGDAPWVYYNDGAKDMKLAVDKDINGLQGEIDALWEAIRPSY
jgi:hypothetical protein